MNVTVLPGSELTAEHVAAWSAMQRANPLLASPFFCPEFTQATAAVRSDVEVAVLEESGTIVGFFPYQRKRWNIAKPVAAGLNDFQGVICDPQLDFDPRQILLSCRLWSFELDHLVAAQAPWQPHQWDRRPSPHIDVGGGLETYLKRRGTESGWVRDVQRSLRKLGRELGPLRFEFHTAAPDIFASLLRWKSEQYRRTRATNVFALNWTVQLLKRLLERPAGELRPELSALWAGDRLAAVQFSLRCRATLHLWFPSYDRELAKYSPGGGLDFKLIEHSPAAGIERIELGAGPAAYKNRIATGATTVAWASVSRLPMLAEVRNRLRKTRVWVRTSPLRMPARVVATWTRPLRGWLSMR